MSTITWRWELDSNNLKAHAGWDGNPLTLCGANASKPMFRPPWFDFRCVTCERLRAGAMERYQNPTPELSKRIPTMFEIQSKGIGMLGHQPFLLVSYGDEVHDALPIQEVPPMPTAKDAMELSMVVAWQILDTISKELGIEISTST